jgi:hypothetical protein
MTGFFEAGEGHRGTEADSRFVHKRAKPAYPQPQRRGTHNDQLPFCLKQKEEPMPEKTIDFDENTEVGGFNPERRKEKKKDQAEIGPGATDDPHGNADGDVKRKIEEGLTKLPPG